MVNVIVLRGVLHRSGCDVECEILAWKGSPGSKHAYSQMRVVEAPDDLPDGEYTLEIDGVSISTKRKGGSWLMVPFEHPRT
jgi:hypothetical protein